MKKLLLLTLYCLFPFLISAKESKQEINILLIGDSTTRGASVYIANPDWKGLHGSIELLASGDKSLPKLHCYNSSAGGETAKSVIETGRYKKEIQNHKDKNIDYIFVRYGINDWFRCKNLQKELPVDLKNLYAKLRKDFPNAKIISMSIIPFFANDRSETVNTIIKNVAKEENLQYLDIFTPYCKIADKIGIINLRARKIDLNLVDSKYHPFLEKYTKKNQWAGKGKPPKSIVGANGPILDPILSKYKQWNSDAHPNEVGYNIIAVETIKFLKKEFL